ncbi:MAG TPA: hypothetical protein VHB21_23680 [Minicystis sp.]|nr:hypothetical protein [Minicystis sp.]
MPSRRVACCIAVSFAVVAAPLACSDAAGDGGGGSASTGPGDPPTLCDAEVPLGGRCALDSQCADPDAVCAGSDYAKLRCGAYLERGDTSKPGLCKRRCASDADCGGVGQGLCDDGVCAMPCDPMTNAGCAAACVFFPHGSDTSTDCVAEDPYGCGPGQVGVNEAYASIEYLEDFASLGSLPKCEVLCRLDHPEDCAADPFASVSACAPLDTGVLRDASGQRYGTCRGTCSTTGCVGTSLCVDDVQPGKPASSTCLSNCDFAGDSCCDPNPEYTTYPDDVLATCLAPYWTDCVPSCAADADCPAGQVCVPPDRLPPGLCPGRQCVATCMLPPWSCAPFWTTSGCDGDQTCAMVPAAAGGWQFSCVPQGTSVYPEPCDVSAGGCAPGYVCVSYGTPTEGVCEARCATTDGCATGQTCGETPGEISYGDETIRDEGTCKRPCDPVDPASTCLSGMTCVEFGDADGIAEADCAFATGNGTGPGDCAGDPLACAPGYTCRPSDGACLAWCYAGQSSSCPMGTTCVVDAPPVVVQGVGYGTCQ